MKHSSYKYIFFFNVVALVASLITISVMNFNKDNSQGSIRASITTPLICAETLEAEFCKNAGAAVIIDVKSGAVLYEKNAQTRMSMASTTKIMTALAVIENSSFDKIITVSKNAAEVEGSSIYLYEGEKISVGDLLYGLMLESGNDAAIALAEGVFGSVELCCDYMNKRCHEMGLVNTNFVNPHGLDDENHYTTAYELAVITRHAMENEIFREIVSSANYVTTGEKTRYFSNHNRLLRNNSSFVGVKTGYTSKSGRCLVSATNKDEKEYVAVTLNDSFDWEDHKNMHKYAHDNFCNYEIAKRDSFAVFSGFSQYRGFDNVYVTTTRDSEFWLNYKITTDGRTGRVEYSASTTSLGNFQIQNLNQEN